IARTPAGEGARLPGGGEGDFAGVPRAEPTRGLAEQPLLDQPFAGVGPRRGRPRRAPLVERLRREPLLRLAAESQGRRLVDEYLERERLRPVSTIDVPSVSLMLSYVSGGLGIGLAPAVALAEISRQHVVVERARVPALPVKLVSRLNGRRSPVAVRFAAQLGAEGRRAALRLARHPLR